ncbi:MAG: hypothetical protein CMJ81_13555 [Planctomycetaceae bacterium]|nr:hypothetical protein [Planctomycetaceae bacterium]MBP62546.1 hypothetical protein [Planctomycetaceae bacterium]
MRPPLFDFLNSPKPQPKLAPETEGILDRQPLPPLQVNLRGFSKLALSRIYRPTSMHFMRAACRFDWMQAFNEVRDGSWQERWWQGQ